MIRTIGNACSGGNHNMLVTCARFRHENTCHAYTVKEAMAALVLEKENDGTLHDAVFDRRTFEPITQADVENARHDLLRLCNWIESRLHYGIHSAWYGAPDCFSMMLIGCIWQTSGLHSDTLQNFQSATGNAGKAFTNARPGNTGRT